MIIRNNLSQEELINAIDETSDTEKCLASKIGEEEAEQIVLNLKVEYYNTKERLYEWAKLQGSYSGHVRTIDTDVANYGQYCNN